MEVPINLSKSTVSGRVFGFLGYLIWSAAIWRFQESGDKPQRIGPLSSGRPRKGPAICGDIHVVLIRISSKPCLISTQSPLKEPCHSLLKVPQLME